MHFLLLSYRRCEHALALGPIPRLLTRVMLDRSRRTGILTCAALHTVVYVRGRRLPIDYLVDARRAHDGALAHALALLVVDLDHDPELLALPPPYVGHRCPPLEDARSTRGRNDMVCAKPRTPQWKGEEIMYGPTSRKPQAGGRTGWRSTRWR